MTGCFVGCSIGAQSFHPTQNTWVTSYFPAPCLHWPIQYFQVFATALLNIRKEKSCLRLKICSEHKHPKIVPFPWISSLDFQNVLDISPSTLTSPERVVLRLHPSEMPLIPREGSEKLAVLHGKHRTSETRRALEKLTEVFCTYIIEQVGRRALHTSSKY